YSHNPFCFQNRGRKIYDIATLHYSRKTHVQMPGVWHTHSSYKRNFPQREMGDTEHMLWLPNNGLTRAAD
ncbi:MAG: hypothetical protein L6408_05415, partial [Nanoarchaeota archaeon]|nr:hypothetical protein [Nanoarchaeota archaeon]